MKRRGSTTGAATGRFRSWTAGDTIDAPEGEFNHLSSRMYNARVIEPEQSDPQPSGTAKTRYEIVQSGGWTKVLDGSGEQVGSAIRGTGDDAKAEAQAQIDALTNG